MINVLYGPGGSGKSLWQMHIIVHELRFSPRNIVTNMSIIVPRFAEYLEEKYPGEKLNLLQRLRILTPAESGEFWKFRGPLLYLGPDVYDFGVDRGDKGVAFIIDEAGACGFSAMGYAQRLSRVTRGEEFAFYLDQQRKFSDNVYMSTNGRTPHGIAKPVRDKAHEFTRLKNGALAQYGIFRGSGKFYRYHYAMEPDRTVEPFQQGTFPQDWEGLASCYRTQDGIGVVGIEADKGSRARGIPVWTVVPMVMCLGLMVVVVPWVAGRSLTRWVSEPIAKKVKAATPEKVARSSDARATAREVVPIHSAPLPVADSKVWVTGYLVRNGQRHAVLSDGSIVREEDKRITAVGGGRLRLDGAVQTLKPSPVVAVKVEEPKRLFDGAWIENPESQSPVEDNEQEPPAPEPRAREAGPGPGQRPGR